MIKILIADDHAIVRAGLRQIVAEHADMEVAGEAATGAEVIEMVRKSDWSVVLLDISMPDQNGVDTLKRVRQIKPDLPVLILSGFPEHQYAVNLMRTGASGYLNKQSIPEELVTAIRAVAKGKKYVSPALGQILVKELSQPEGDRPLQDSLSEREFQIFCKLAAGVGVSKIAEELHLSVKTISTYRTRVLEKMHMKTNADLTYYAIKNQLIE